MHAVASDDTVSRPLVLDLEHDPFVGLIGDGQRFGDYPVEAGSFELFEPSLCGREVGGRWCEVDRGTGVGQRLNECVAALGKRPPGVVLVAQCEGDRTL